MTKNGTLSQQQAKIGSQSEEERKALQLLRDFSRDSRQTVKKPIRPQFGNRYVSPRSP